jgi:hypothetical protein
METRVGGEGRFQIVGISTGLLLRGARKMAGLDQMRYTAFEGFRLIASGELASVATKTKKVFDRGEKAPVLIFADLTGEPVELDFRGTAGDVLSRVSGASEREHVSTQTLADGGGELPRGPGRPRLGVVAREVTLLPRHWSWLNEQPGGASVALRKLVDQARRANAEKDRMRRLQERTYRFMSTIAGNLPGFEEASRALFAWDLDRFRELIQGWPKDIRAHLERLAQENLADVNARVGE